MVNPVKKGRVGRWNSEGIEEKKTDPFSYTKSHGCRQGEETPLPSAIDHRDRWPLGGRKEHCCEVFGQTIRLRLY